MKTIALLPGLDGTGKLYAPLQSELSEFKTQVFSYPPEFIDPKRIAEHLLSHNDFSSIDLFVAESYGCRVLCEMSKFQTHANKPSIFIAGFSSITSGYKLLLKSPDFILKPIYSKGSSKLVLNHFCLGNTKDQNLVSLLKETLSLVPYETAIGRLRYLANELFVNMRVSVNESKCLLALKDRLLTINQQRNFAELIKTNKIIEVDGPHFLVQTKTSEVARVIRKSVM